VFLQRKKRLVGRCEVAGGRKFHTISVTNGASPDLAAWLRADI
jgi:hypothetical protein